MNRTFRLRVLPDDLAICSLGADQPVPAWGMSGPLWSVTRTPDELSVVCAQVNVPEGVKAERNWRSLQVVGPLPFDMVGVLASLVVPLAEAGISIFALAPFETDYILVRADVLDAACEALVKAGHIMNNNQQPMDTG